MNVIEEALQLWAALRVAATQAATVRAGEVVEIDIPDILVSARVKGQAVRVKIVSVNVERLQ